MIDYQSIYFGFSLFWSSFCCQRLYLLSSYLVLLDHVLCRCAKLIFSWIVKDPIAVFAVNLDVVINYIDVNVVLQFGITIDINVHVWYWCCYTPSYLRCFYCILSIV